MEKQNGRNEILISRVVFKLKLKYKQTKYEGNMTETSSKDVLRSTTVMFLFVGFVGMWIDGCQNKKQKEIRRLIKNRLLGLGG